MAVADRFVEKRRADDNEDTVLSRLGRIMTKPHPLQTGMIQQAYFTASMVTVIDDTADILSALNEVVMWPTVNVPGEKGANNGELWRKKVKSSHGSFKSPFQPPMIACWQHQHAQSNCLANTSRSQKGTTPRVS